MREYLASTTVAAEFTIPRTEEENKQSSYQKKAVDFSDQTNANIDNRSYQFVTASSIVICLPKDLQEKARFSP